MKDNGFDRAQAQYDAMMPPEDNRVECPDCEETGKVGESNCCGAPILMGDLCAECKEHCEEADCPRCNGDGYIDGEGEKREAYEEWLEKKADEARDETLSDTKVGSDLDRFLGNKEV